MDPVWAGERQDCDPSTGQFDYLTVFDAGFIEGLSCVTVAVSNH